ncbi:MFS transporter [Pigmentibacter sp. JX0631]|uniref:MFS transporter n=1 Tax=Pigmentibacter sp. JX0631 TaxID=2976982 RepID=UPI002468A94D|nr:MFS transporter [Pigmentibacter sp. JX0631]WGL59798.1 MFS transporter [Pigmentibacter sp. JX0631]
MENSNKSLLILTLVVFIGFLTIGIPLPVLPLFVTKELLYSSAIAGIVIAAQSISTMLTRKYSGKLSDIKGSKKIVLLGLLLCAFASLTYYSSYLVSSTSNLSLAILLIGRVVLGLGESMVMTGALSWGIGLAGTSNSAKVMSWMGLALYGAFAFGAPIGMELYKIGGLQIISLVITSLPVIAFLIALKLPNTVVTTIIPNNQRIQFLILLKDIWLPGAGMALGAIGFGIIATFMTLYYASKQWNGASLCLTVFASAYILVRILFPNMIQKYGGTRILVFLLLVETIGQSTILLFNNPIIAILGSALTGIGYSLVFPAFGVEVVKKIPEQSRGEALGIYTAFFDLALGITGPIFGFIIYLVGYQYAFLGGTVTSILALFIAIFLNRKTMQKVIN